MKCHKWTINDEGRLLNAIDECEPLFEHFKEQGESYNEMNVWDAIAGRMLPLTLTGAACKRHFEIMNDRGNDEWKKTAEMVEQYERELAESTYDEIQDITAALYTLADNITEIKREISEIMELWK